eukprot:350069-Chlamydomonas_euryale.AAC.4
MLALRSPLSKAVCVNLSSSTLCAALAASPACHVALARVLTCSLLHLLLLLRVTWRLPACLLARCCTCCFSCVSRGACPRAYLLSAAPAASRTCHVALAR